jgi:hypothetical protein
MESSKFDASSIQFGSVNAAGGKITVPFDKVRIVTGTVVLKNALVDADGSVAPFAKLAFESDADADAFGSFEEALIAAAKERREEWFGSVDVSDEHIEGSFKRFFSDGILKARVTSQTFAFDSAGNSKDIAAFSSGEKAKVLISASVVRIGKSEFGAVWTVEQIRESKKLVCLIADEEESIVDDEDSWVV